MLMIFVLELDHFTIFFQNVGPFLIHKVIKDQIPEKVFLLILQKWLVLNVVLKLHIKECVFQEVLVIGQDRFIHFHHKQANGHADLAFEVFWVLFEMSGIDFVPALVSNQYERF
jgi:hypothetical protein